MKLKFSARQVALVDEFGAVETQLDAFAATIKPLKEREKELREQILEIVKDLPANEACGMDGDRYAVTISERRVERTIKSMKRVFAAIGQADFLKHCSFSLKGLRELLVADDIANLVSEAATGPREVIATPRLAIFKKKAA